MRGLGSWELPPARLGLNRRPLAPTGAEAAIAFIASYPAAVSPPSTASRIHRKELPPAKMLTAEVKRPGTTWVNT